MCLLGLVSYSSFAKVGSRVLGDQIAQILGEKTHFIAFYGQICMSLRLPLTAYNSLEKEEEGKAFLGSFVIAL